jgi:hypothetical protein
MAHSIGTITARSSGSTNPLTAAVTVAQGETVLVVLLKVNGATDRAGGALTYAGVNMTQGNTTQKAAASPEASTEAWYLVNPPVGTANVSIPNSGSLTIFVQPVAARAPAGGASVFANAWGSNGTSANPSCGSGVLPEAGNIVFATVASGAQTWNPSARTGTQIQDTDDGAHGGGTQYLIVNTPVPAGQDMAWTQASEDWGAVAVAFHERPAVSFNNYLAVKVAGDGMSVNDRIR